MKFRGGPTRRQQALLRKSRRGRLLALRPRGGQSEERLDGACILIISSERVGVALGRTL